MRKKTALQDPGSRKASPNQTKGLVAKDQKAEEPAQDGCALDNRSHRTFSGFRTGAKPSATRLTLLRCLHVRSQTQDRSRRLLWSGRRPRKRKPFC